MNLVFFLAIVVVVLAIYRNRSLSSYFILISFDWFTVYELFGISDEECKTFEVNKNYYVSSGVSVTDGNRANFEYYITPKAIRGPYPCSIIFDQQQKTFHESPHADYRDVITGKTATGHKTAISCGFAAHMLDGKKAGFWIQYRKDISDFKMEMKTLVLVFDDKFLELTDAHSRHGNLIPREVYLLEYKNADYHSVGDVKTEKMTVKQDDFWLQTNIQSTLDMGPFVSEIADIFDQDIRRFEKNAKDKFKSRNKAAA